MSHLSCPGGGSLLSANIELPQSGFTHKADRLMESGYPSRQLEQWKESPTKLRAGCCGEGKIYHQKCQINRIKLLTESLEALASIDALTWMPSRCASACAWYDVANHLRSCWTLKFVFDRFVNFLGGKRINFMVEWSNTLHIALYWRLFAQEKKYFEYFRDIHNGNHKMSYLLHAFGLFCLSPQKYLSPLFGL